MITVLITITIKYTLSLLCCKFLLPAAPLFGCCRSFHFGQLKLNDTAAPRAFKLLEDGKKTEALMLINGHQNPSAKALSRCLQLFSNKYLSLQQARDEAYRGARLQAEQLSSHLRILEVIAWYGTGHDRGLSRHGSGR